MKAERRNTVLTNLTSENIMTSSSEDIKKLEVKLKNTKIQKTLIYSSETLTLMKRDRKQLNTFERKVYRRI
jgi:hypothetical protein